MNKLEIAAVAAQLVVDEGLDYGAAKLRAIRQLGLPERTPLPDNDEVEGAVREHLALYCAHTQPAELRALRELAVRWMERLAEYRPYLSGAVWRGTATRLSDIHLQLFCDDEKAPEIALINQGVRYQAHMRRGMRGRDVSVLSLHAPCPTLGEIVGVHLTIEDRDDVRGALRPDTRKRSVRGDLQALRRLLDEDEGEG